jgi:hypothetical protein
MGTAVASTVLCIGAYVAMGRLPGFMTYSPPAHATPRSSAAPRD